MKFLLTFLAAISLGGIWDFRFEENKSLEQVYDLGFTANDKMCVPGCWDMMPDYYLKRGTALYRRTFTVEKDFKDAVLEIEGMGLRGRFSIDGRELGEYPYPYAKLEIPVGKLGKGEHEIVAALDNRFDKEKMKLARSFYDFYLFGGFYRGVRIVEKEPKIFVRTLDYRTGLIEVEVEGGRKFRKTLKNFKLWSPEEPNMTMIEVDGRKVRFGVRQIEARDKKLWLNGKELFLKGVNRHDQSPLGGSTVPEAEWVQDLQHLKDLGGNFIRGAHYQQADRFLELCDEMGVLVWEESLGWGNGQDYTKSIGDFTDSEFREQQIRQTRDMVRNSFNHPSVIIYAFLNEPGSWSKECKSLIDELIATVKAENSGRLVTFACNMGVNDICNENTDLIAINNYPGVIPCYPGEPATLRKKVNESFDKIVASFRTRYPDKPIMISETGYGAVYGWHDQAASVSTEEFQVEYLTYAFENFWNNPDIIGFAVWQMNDNRTYSRNSEDQPAKTFMAMSHAGLYNFFRQPKKSVETVRHYFSLK